MSEITTGSVPISDVKAPSLLNACTSAVDNAARYCIRQYEHYLTQLEESNERLKWLDKQVVSSPAQMAAEAKRLQEAVGSDEVFLEMTDGMTSVQKDILAGVIATQNSPLNAYVSPILEDSQNHEMDFEAVLKNGVRNLASDNFKFVNSVLKDAARIAGFSQEIRILRESDTLSDIVFVDRENRKFTAYCKLDKNLNPAVALDLEGFACDDRKCSIKMDQIITYLQEHGVPFPHRRIRHNQPMGVLRRMLNRISASQAKVEEYLQGGVIDKSKKQKTYQR